MNDYFDRLETQLAALTERGAHNRRRVQPLRIPRISLGIAALAAFSVIVLAIPVLLLSARHSQAPSAPGQRSVEDGRGHRRDHGAIDPALTRNFRILRRPRQRSDQLPAALANISTTGGSRFPLPAGQPKPPSLGLAPARSRSTIVPGLGSRVWIVPGKHGLCWDAENPSGQLMGGICGPLVHQDTAVADDNGLAIYSGITIGLVTDRVLSLELRTPAGQRRSIPINEGFYSVAYKPGDRVIAITANGRHTLLPTSPR